MKKKRLDYEKIKLDCEKTKLDCEEIKPDKEKFNWTVGLLSHCKNTEKPTFFILKDDSILRTVLSEFPVNSLRFEYLSNQRTKTTI